jgi:hypothetical protein
MDLLLDLPNIEFLKQIVGPDLFKYLIIVSIVLRAVNSHFKKIEESVEGIRFELKDLKQSFNSSQRTIDKRVSNLEAYNEANTYKIGELEVLFKQTREG